MKKGVLLIVTLFVSVAVYGQDKQRDSFLVYKPSISEQSDYHILAPILLIYVTVENDKIIGFSLRTDDLNYSSIELTMQDFKTLKNVFEKALEWNTIARQNDVNSFDKKIPFTISSSNVSWYQFVQDRHHTIQNGQILTLEFTFSWSPVYFAQGALSIKSNTINTSTPGSRATYLFSKNNIRQAEIELLLANITEEKIQEAIINGRIKKTEEEARKKRTETLFE